MRKVTTINLGGRAYQLEEQACDRLQKYLHHAETALAKNPDKTEVLGDIEQAIAEKCDRLFVNGKNVATEAQIETILVQMGEVESDSADKIGGKTAAPASEAPGRTKRLFVIPDGAVLAGVANGVGAYFGIDPNWVRGIFVLITLFTSGAGILVYIVLALLLPTARTEAELAEAHDKPITAQDIVARAKERTPSPETVRDISVIAVKMIRMVAKIVGVMVAIVFGILTSVWLLGMWHVVLGNITFSDQLQVLNGWRVGAAITAAYLLVGLPVFLLFRLLDRLSESRKPTRTAAAAEGSMAVLWFAALMLVLALATTYGQAARDYANSHDGKIDVSGSHICIDASKCDPSVKIDEPPADFAQ